MLVLEEGEERVWVGDRKGEIMWSKRERDEEECGGEVHRQEEGGEPNG